MTRSSILYTRTTRWQPADALIRAWDAGHMSHAGIRLGDWVIDAAVWGGVARTYLPDWMHGREIVADLPVLSTSQGTQEQAESELFDRIGQRYDLAELAGFVLLRDLGDPDRPVCSRLGYDFLATACGLRIPGRQGRIGPRLLHTAHHSFNLGRSAVFTPGQSA